MIIKAIADIYAENPILAQTFNKAQTQRASKEGEEQGLAAHCHPWHRCTSPSVDVAKSL